MIRYSEPNHLCNLILNFIGTGAGKTTVHFKPVAKQAFGSFLYNGMEVKIKLIRGKGMGMAGIKGNPSSDLLYLIYIVSLKTF